MAKTGMVLHAEATDFPWLFLFLQLLEQNLLLAFALKQDHYGVNHNFKIQCQ